MRCTLKMRLDVLQDMSKLTLEDIRAIREEALELTALMATQPICPGGPPENQGSPSLMALAQAYANTLARKVINLRMLLLSARSMRLLLPCTVVSAAHCAVTRIIRRILSSRLCHKTFVELPHD